MIGETEERLGYLFNRFLSRKNIKLIDILRMSSISFIIWAGFGTAGMITLMNAKLLYDAIIPPDSIYFVCVNSSLCPFGEFFLYFLLSKLTEHVFV